jgi:hypothetical protein
MSLFTLIAAAPDPIVTATDLLEPMSEGTLVIRQEANPFYFEDSQVVLQVSHVSFVISYSSILLTLLSSGRGNEVQNPSLLPNPGVRIFQRLILPPSIWGLGNCRGFR